MKITNKKKFIVRILELITIIATIIDCPATVLNVVGNTSSAMIVSRIVDGKDCLKEEK